MKVQDILYNFVINRYFIFIGSIGMKQENENEGSLMEKYNVLSSVKGMHGRLNEYYDKTLVL